MLESFDFQILGTIIISLALAGAISGILAGLFGIGGGTILVPVLMELLIFLDVSPNVLSHIAIGTSLAVIVATSISSFRSHLVQGKPETHLLKRWIIWVPLGVFVAAFIVSGISGNSLRIIFACLAIIMAFKMVFARQNWQFANDLPGPLGNSIAGFIMGGLSTFMGVGGGLFNNIYMTSFGRPIHQAIATSAGLGVLTAIPGTLGYMWAGWGNPDLPPFSVGFVNILAVFLIIPTSFFCAPLGSKLAHKLNKRNMEIAFGIFLFLVALRMFWSVL